MDRIDPQWMDPLGTNAIARADVDGTWSPCDLHSLKKKWTSKPTLSYGRITLPRIYCNRAKEMHTVAGGLNRKAMRYEDSTWNDYE